MPSLYCGMRFPSEGYLLQVPACRGIACLLARYERDDDAREPSTAKPSQPRQRQPETNHANIYSSLTKRKYFLLILRNIISACPHEVHTDYTVQLSLARILCMQSTWIDFDCSTTHGDFVYIGKVEVVLGQLTGKRMAHGSALRICKM